MGDQTGHTAEIVRDPGLLTADRYPALQPEKSDSGKPVAGLGPIGPIALRYHGDHGLTAAYLNTWYVQTAESLTANGFQVRVFTNGSPEDRRYASALQDHLQALNSGGAIIFLTQDDPKGMCRHIASFDVLIAHRMHAIIAAYSYRVPAIALAWDDKLHAFMQSVGRETDLLEVATTSPIQCAAHAVRTLNLGISPTEHRDVLAETRADVGRLLAVLRSPDRPAASSAGRVNPA